MNSQNLETPVLLFKSAVDRVFEYTNGANIADAIMRRYSDYAYLIQDIQAVRDVEMLEELNKTYTDPNLYDPADDLCNMRYAVMLLMAASDFYRTITTEEKTNYPEQPQVPKFAYDALKKDYDNLKRMFEIEKQATETLLRSSKTPEETNK